MSDSSEMTLEAAKAEVERLSRELSDAKALVRELRPVKSAAEPKLCACGECGLMTGGGDFRPGHDAKLRSRLLKAIDAGDEGAIDALMARPTLLHGATEAELRERLGSEAKRKAAIVERQAEAQTKRDAKAKPSKEATKELKAELRREAAKTPAPRVDKVEQQQGTRSDTNKRNGAAIRLAQSRA